MSHNLLILGGTTEATALAHVVAEAGIPATLSYAGRVARPKQQPIAHRVGGFGGVDGLAAHLREHAITHVVDATHPFAAQMSHNAVTACDKLGIPLIALTRPPWQPAPADNWHTTQDITGAVAALAGPRQRILLAIGRQHIDTFAAQPQHHYVLRLVDPPERPPLLPDHTIIVSRGPFTEAGDIILMRSHGIERVVAKNAGGTGAIAKVQAARALQIPMIMINRQPLPHRRETHSTAGVMAWLHHDTGTDLGV